MSVEHQRRKTGKIYHLNGSFLRKRWFLAVAARSISLVGETSVILEDVANRLELLEEDYGKDIVVKIVETFIPDAEVRIERIDRAIRQEDSRALEEAAHGLKSGAANIGATEMARLCGQLETQGELGDIGDAEEVMKSLMASWSRVRTEMARYR